MQLIKLLGFILLCTVNSVQADNYNFYTDQKALSEISISNLRYLVLKNTSITTVTKIYILHDNKGQHRIVINYLGIAPSRFKEITTNNPKFTVVPSIFAMKVKLLRCIKCIGINQEFIMKYDSTANKIYKIRIKY